MTNTRILIDENLIVSLLPSIFGEQAFAFVFGLDARAEIEEMPGRAGHDTLSILHKTLGQGNGNVQVEQIQQFLQQSHIQVEEKFRLAEQDGKQIVGIIVEESR